MTTAMEADFKGISALRAATERFMESMVEAQKWQKNAAQYMEGVIDKRFKDGGPNDYGNDWAPLDGTYKKRKAKKYKKTALMQTTGLLKKSIFKGMNKGALELSIGKAASYGIYHHSPLLTGEVSLGIMPNRSFLYGNEDNHKRILKYYGRDLNAAWKGAFGHGA